MRNLESLEDKHRIISTYRTVVVMISTEWCGPCKIMTPKVENLCDRKKVMCVKEDASLGMTEDIVSVPVYQIYKGGKLIHDIRNGLSIQELEELL